MQICEQIGKLAGSWYKRGLSLSLLSLAFSCFFISEIYFIYYAIYLFQFPMEIFFFFFFFLTTLLSTIIPDTFFYITTIQQE